VVKQRRIEFLKETGQMCKKPEDCTDSGDEKKRGEYTTTRDPVGHNKGQKPETKKMEHKKKKSAGFRVFGKLKNWGCS